LEAQGQGGFTAGFFSCSWVATISLWALMTSSLCAVGERQPCCPSSPYKGTSSNISSVLNPLLKVTSPNDITLEVRASACEFWGNIIQILLYFIKSYASSRPLPWKPASSSQERQPGKGCLRGGSGTRGRKPLSRAPQWAMATTNCRASLMGPLS
jgi:hypothetical protein